jgi:farnesyl diphosphate synthase
MSFEARLGAVARDVAALLDALLNDSPLPGEIARPTRLVAAMRHGALNGGKRLRPFLTVEAARLLGVSGPGVLRAACAVELVHCYSLVHDDLPAMDDDDLRRGQPTVHRAYDEATAILAGDSLLTLAFDVMADEATHPDATVRAALVLGLARASGLGGMAGGQMYDLAAEASLNPHTVEEIARLQAMKTGALLRFAVEAGAIVAGANSEQTAQLVAYGKALGAAFQVADDILDAESDEASLGKAAGKDAGRNKATLVKALGLEAAKSSRDALARQAEEALAGFGEAARILVEAARFTAARRN